MFVRSAVQAAGEWSAQRPVTVASIVVKQAFDFASLSTAGECLD